MNDRFISMQLFARVARGGSFSAAGRELGLSQPSTSRIIAALEERVGAKLLTRTTRGVKLTEAGADFLVRAEAILAAVEEAEHSARGSGELRGTLRIACSSTFAIRSIFPRLGEFSAAHPRLKIEFLLGDHRHDALAEGVDVAIRMGAPINPDAVARKIGVNQRIVVASPAYLARAGLPRRPEDLAHHALIVGPAGHSEESWSFRKADEIVSMPVEGRYRVDGTEAATAAAAQGLGIVSTGHLACLDEMSRGALIRVLPDWDMASVDVYLVFPAARAAKPAARAFGSFLMAAASPAAPTAAAASAAITTAAG